MWLNTRSATDGPCLGYVVSGDSGSNDSRCSPRLVNLLMNGLCLTVLSLLRVFLLTVHLFTTILFPTIKLTIHIPGYDSMKSQFCQQWLDSPYGGQQWLLKNCQVSSIPMIVYSFLLAFYCILYVKDTIIWAFTRYIPKSSRLTEMHTWNISRCEIYICVTENKLTFHISIIWKGIVLAHN